MEFNFQVNISFRFTEEGYQKLIGIFGDNTAFKDTFKKAVKEMILDELKHDIDTGMVEVNINVMD